MGEGMWLRDNSHPDLFIRWHFTRTSPLSGSIALVIPAAPDVLAEQRETKALSVSLRPSDCLWSPLTSGITHRCIVVGRRRIVSLPEERERGRLSFARSICLVNQITAAAAVNFSLGPK